MLHEAEKSTAPHLSLKISDLQLLGTCIEPHWAMTTLGTTSTAMKGAWFQRLGWAGCCPLFAIGFQQVN